MSRQRKSQTEYDKALKAFHKVSERHVLVLEANLTEDEKRNIFGYSERIRKAGNDLVGIMKPKLDQFLRTRKYRKLMELYSKYKKAENKEKCKEIGAQMNEIQKAFNITWDFCRKSMIPIGKRYGIDAVFALTKAEDVWRAIETCLCGDGEIIHFTKKGDLPCIRAKQLRQGIIPKVKDKSIEYSFDKMKFFAPAIDKFQKDELGAVIKYLKNKEAIDAFAVKSFLDDGVIESTYRPCYVSLVPIEIRGKLRVYVHLTIEGKAKEKYDRYGNPRHTYGIGIVGCDIGTQTIAYTTDTEVGLKNLAERGPSIFENERKERLLNRAMDRSRRATNPDNYNDDGTIKKGRKKWKKSKRYRDLQKRHKELCRKNAVNRKLAIQEEVNHLRSLGNVFVAEPKNAKRLQKKSKGGVNEKGKQKKRKRFGKSIQNRCPGFFQADAERKFSQGSGSRYVEVPMSYRASQYDHSVNDYIPKKLRQRMYYLRNGPEVQRNMYSSYLLYNINFTNMDIDKEKVKDEFENFYKKETAFIEWVKANGIKIKNSGIKVA